jgi:hypothetical protein
MQASHSEPSACASVHAPLPHLSWWYRIRNGSSEHIQNTTLQHYYCMCNNHHSWRGYSTALDENWKGTEIFCGCCVSGVRTMRAWRRKKCRRRLCFRAGFPGWKSSPQGDIRRTARHVREEGERRPFMICWPCLFDLRFFLSNIIRCLLRFLLIIISITHRPARARNRRVLLFYSLCLLSRCFRKWSTIRYAATCDREKFREMKFGSSLDESVKKH